LDGLPAHCLGPWGEHREPGTKRQSSYRQRPSFTNYQALHLALAYEGGPRGGTAYRLNEGTQDGVPIARIAARKSTSPLPPHPPAWLVEDFGADAAAALLREAEAWASAQCELLSGVEAMWVGWMQRRREALDASARSLTQICEYRTRQMVRSVTNGHSDMLVGPSRRGGI